MNVTVTFNDGEPFGASVFVLDENTANLLYRALVLKEKVDSKFGDYNSLHEAYGVIKEEMYEFEQLVFLKQSKRNQDDIDSELIDIISCCLRATNVDISK